jgi:hypothetical protein
MVMLDDFCLHKAISLHTHCVLVKMNMIRTRCMLFYFAKTIELLCELRKHFPFLFTPPFLFIPVDP